MALEVPMPVITASGEEAVVTAWFVDEGEACTQGKLIAEVQAEKVAAEVNAPGAGYIVDRVEVNDPVPQGDPICRIVESVEKPTTRPSAPPATGEKTPPPRVVASPAARRLAKELGVDLSALTGTGPDGRVTEADVKAASETRPAAASGLRAVIARNMLRSHTETAAVTLHSTVDLGAQAPSQVTATVVKTVAETLANHPQLNGHRDGDRFVPADVAHVAVAIQTDEGLVAPVVRNTASWSVKEIAETITSLAERAAAKTLTAGDYEGGTFTVTNLGPYGIDGFTPIINLPQVAILGIGTIRQVPVVDDNGEIATRNQMVLSLTFDHVFVDGAPAAAFLQEVGAALTG
ncbi:MAG TPA: dihydrolipoamide acetyltransferase family protein [Acidimicrobiia bacterium]